MARPRVRECATRRGVYVSVDVVTDPDADPADIHAAIYEAAIKALRRFPDVLRPVVAEAVLPPPVLMKPVP